MSATEDRAALAAEMARAFRAATERAAADAEWQPTARPLGALLTDATVTAPPRWVLPPLVESGEVALLSAPPKTGKSHFVSQLAATLSTGGVALDGTPLPAGVVLWLGLDEPARRLVPRLAALGAHPERFHIVQREPGHVLTSDHLKALLAEYRPALVVLDTTSQLALDARVDPNDGSQVGPFLRPLVDAVRGASTADTPCAGVFIHHAPHHAARAAGSLQWGAIVDADLVLRRRRRGVDPRAAEPDDAEDAPGGDDGTRILEGVTRAAGPLKLRLAFVAGRYALADAAVPLIERARALLTQLDCGPGVSSAAKLRDHLKCNDAALSTVLTTLEGRGELRFVGATRSPSRHVVPTDAMRVYVQGGGAAEEVSGRGEDAGRSGERAAQDAQPLGATSSALHGYPHAGGKKSDAPSTLRGASQPVDADAADAASHVLAALRASGRQLYPNQLVAHTGLPRTSIVRAVAQLVSAGAVTETSDGAVIAASSGLPVGADLATVLPSVPEERESASPVLAVYGDAAAA